MPSAKVDPTFTPPQTLEDAESRRQLLTGEIEAIQAQLGERNRTDNQGNRLSAQQYWSWKRHARHAMNEKLEELRALKTWIRDQRRTLLAPTAFQHLPAGLIDAANHLKRLLQIVTDLEGEDVEFDRDEMAQIDAARVFLRRLDTGGANAPATPTPAPRFRG